MKPRLILTSAGMLGCLTLSYFYFNSHSRYAAHHQLMLGLISDAKEVEASLTANLLKSRDFLLLNYDPILANTNEMRGICQKLADPELRTSAMAAPGLGAKAEEYCRALENTVRRVELFKSKNSVLRNSVFFVQSMAGKFRDRPRSLRAEMLDASLSYYLLPTETERSFLEARLANGPASDPVSWHVRTVLERKIEVNGLLREIIDAPSHALLGEFEKAYDRAYQRAEVSAGLYRSLLFWSAILLLVLVLYGITRVFRAARSLAEANERLEFRVRERTRELSESKNLILQQQQTLLANTKMSALGEMAAGMAHEINTPLAIIQLNANQLAEVLQTQPLREKLALKMLSSIEDTTKRIAKIVQGLRTFSRDGSSDPFVPVNVEQLVSDTVAFCGERFRNHGVTLKIDAIDPSLAFLGRASQISQVLLNLIANGFDAVEGQAEPWVRVEARAQGEWVEIRVSDNGPGIGAETRRKIFQPFFTTKEIGKGTGMGLSISLGIAGAHGGALTLEDAAPLTTFCLRLRAAESRPAV